MLTQYPESSLTSKTLIYVAKALSIDKTVSERGKLVLMLVFINLFRGFLIACGHALDQDEI